MQPNNKPPTTNGLKIRANMPKLCLGKIYSNNNKKLPILELDNNDYLTIETRNKCDLQYLVYISENKP